MALALRLRRAIVVSSTPLLRPAASASISRPFSLSPFVPVPLQLPRPWRIPGAAAGFRSTAEAAAAADSKVSPDDIPANGCDYNYWLITMKFPDPKPPREEMIETYLQTLAKVVGRNFQFTEVVQSSIGKLRFCFKDHTISFISIVLFILPCVLLAGIFVPVTYVW
ncbi:hypothetical protein BAE44_0026132 [Dichanthelium oligosanthes]|uniref:MORF/ORRM1/DAG-like MORF domain-containing protein n=1 Tax=Dichanthelium oligosanthes TaxID=888268 RepID=A0A1E5UJ03_9POAL|nr:hypothetical protein BAE44_0026132 [Dichanthelium oligosanthes]